MKPQIVIQQVSKIFLTGEGKKLGLSDISCTIESGDIFSVLGPSGCGKSTLINLIAGFIQPSSGTIIVNGQDLPLPGRDRVVVFQDQSLFEWKTVWENVEFGLKASGLLLQKRRAKVQECLELVQMTAYAKLYPYQLSRGMKQRIALARALAVDPSCILLDEPFGSLDQPMRLEMQDELLRLWQRNCHTIILVTHDIDEAIYLSKRIMVLSGQPGHVLGILSVKLPWPRSQRLRDSPDFLEKRHQILELLKSN